ncbi:cysteine-tRNA ligase [Batrachochytrium salamandrivorans]|nr:cysteine-tRNA ligase [Batrachochytrium salamandrivorans]
MSMKILNSLTKTKDLLQASPRTSLVTFYVCGPTVYDSAHLGHGRTYTLFDAMRRVITRVLGKEVVYVMNVTDVDDKILAKCKHTNQARQDLTAKYELEFFQDMSLLGVLKPTVCPRAVEYIPEMVSFIGKLTERGFAYRTQDGSVYMDSVKANARIGYPGALGKGNELATAEGEAAQSSSSLGAKRNPSDFALWKSSTELDNVWDCAPFGGMGRPGWHLECSAMIDATIGHVGAGDGRLDIHGGGVDLCFPHHANERCQSQLHLQDMDQPWAQFFCHTGHVTLQRDKMSKSTGNFITLRQLMSKDVSPRQLRLLFLSQRRYSASLEWTEGSVARAKALDQQFADFFAPISSEHSVHSRLSKEDIGLGEELAVARERVRNAMLDDFDFPKVFDLLQAQCKLFTKHPRSCFADQSKAFVLDTLDILGFGGKEGVQPSYSVSLGKSPDVGHGGDAVSNASNDDEFVDLVVEFRALVRAAAKSGDTQAVLLACDKFRNSHPGQIVIQDQRDGSSTWKRRV